MPVLSEYLPEYIDSASSNRHAKYALAGILNDDAHPRSLRTDHSAYIPANDTDPALASRSIIHSIDWHSVPEDHLLAPERNGDGWTPREWDHISTYARIRGAAAHELYAAPDAESGAQALRDELTAIKTIDSPAEMHGAVYSWTDSHMTPPDDLQHLTDTPREVLYRTCKDDARGIADNWSSAAREHSLHTLVNEATIVETIDGTRYCTRPDQIVYTTDSPSLPDGVYPLDAKAVSRIQPAHYLQAEAQRRAINARVADDADVHAILLRLGVERGDWEIHSSIDDDWPGEKAWEMFTRKAETLYDDGLVDVALGQVE